MEHKNQHTEYNDQSGSWHVLIAMAIVVIGAVGLAWWRVQNKPAANQTAASASTSTTDDTNLTSSSSNPEPEKVAEPDSADTLDSPSKVTSADGKTYFYYGAPAAQNNKSPKRIIISLPGHGTTAEQGYAAWQKHISGGNYALAEFNWWDGDGEKTTDYYVPADVVKQTRAFLDQQGYETGDIVILHGFSRGSANTYAVIANDRVDKASVIDAVISNAGKYQSDFPLFPNRTVSDSQMTQYFKGIPWVLACGGTDPNPDRDGCPGMEETKTFLLAHQANVLGIVTDSKLGHGAFHMSDKKLPQQALDLIEAAL